MPKGMKSNESELSDDIIEIIYMDPYSAYREYTINGQDISRTTKIRARKDGKVYVDHASLYLSLDAPKKDPTWKSDVWFGYDKIGNQIRIFITHQYDKEIKIMNDSDFKLTIHQNEAQSYLLDKSFGKYNKLASLEILTPKGNKISLDKVLHSTGYFYDIGDQKIDGMRIKYGNDKFIITNS
jgi:hypothetical protein